jgi:hypothetical protein
MQRISHSYFVVMIDHGQRGLEAVVHPEDTRRAVVEMLATGESKHVVFIHHVDGLFIEDCTNDLFDEAEALARETEAGYAIAAVLSPVDQQAAAFDRSADYRKHERA